MFVETGRDMISKGLVGLVAMVVLGGGAQRADAQTPSDTLHETPPNETVFIPGVLLVKVTEVAAQAIEQVRQKGVLSVLGIESLDALAIRYGVTTIQRAFPRARRREASEPTVSARTRQAPPDTTARDLLRIYTLQLDPQVDVREAVSAFVADPHVEYAQPSYLATARDQPTVMP